MSSVEAPPFFRIVSSADAAAVLAHDVRLHREAVAHVRDVADVNRRAVHLLDRHIVERGDGVRAAVEARRYIRVRRSSTCRWAG